MSENYADISKAIVEGEDVKATELVEEALAEGLPPLDILNQGVVAGINKTGELWAANQYFLPDVILSADAFKAAMIPLEPKLKASRGGQSINKFVIGVVQGDMHDLGKSLVCAMLTSAGFEVIDLGIDVPKEKFIEAVKQYKPAILGLGAYMSTTMLEMKDVIAELKNQGLRDGLKVVVGGVPTSQEFADEVGADAWGKDAMLAMQKALELVGGRNG
ncbi:MAG: corrinoid protein [Anaerolineales bacterium]|jgi:5-methyltetrahydrofolate--homocysteine methyltransferase